MTNPNTFNDHKYLIIHADDAGLCHAENMATIQAVESGVVNSYSIMVPCAGFEEIAVFAKNNPQYDYGIHLSLTCEWENQRFVPILPVSEVPSLVDSDGFFFKKREALKKSVIASEVKKELEAQIIKALDYGLKPTHLDSHMYSVGITKEIFAIYRELGKKYGLPVCMNKEVLNMVNPVAADYFETDDFLIDHFYLGTYAHFEKGELLDYYYDTLQQLKPGLNILLLHPALDNDEMKDITYNHPNFGSVWRQLDLDFILSKKAKNLIKENGIQLVDWGDIKKLTS